MSDGNIVEIEFDVRCRHGDELYQPAYRVFVDGDLLTERTFIWHNDNQYVRELLTVNVASGRHYLKIDRINDPRNLLEFKNVTVDQKPSNFEFSI